MKLYIYTLCNVSGVSIIFSKLCADLICWEQMVNRTSVMSMDSVSSKLHRNTMMIVPRFLGMTIFLRLLSVRFMFPRFSTILFGKNKQTWTIKRPSSLFQKHDSEATGTSVAYSIFHHLPAGRYSYCSDDIRNYVSKQNGKNGKLTV